MRFPTASTGWLTSAVIASWFGKIRWRTSIFRCAIMIAPALWRTLATTAAACCARLCCLTEILALIRAYRHGGFFRNVATTWFFTWPPRPFRELVLTEELRRRGLRTVEVYAACVSRPAGPFYRGWLITKQLQGAEDLWSAISQRIDRTDWFNRGTARRSGWHPRDAPGRGLPRRS